MADNNKRINELPPIPNAAMAQMLALYDPTSDTTYRVTLAQVIAASGLIPDAWQLGIDYLIGNIVSHDSGFGQQVWVAVNDNTDSEPVTGNVDWRPATASDLNMKVYDGSIPTLSINASDLVEALFKNSNVDGDRTWQFINADNLLRLTVFINLTGAGTWDQDFSGITPPVISDNGNWDSVAKKWQPIQAGKYKLVFEFDGDEFLLTISNLAA